MNTLNPYKVVDDFEKTIAEFTGAKYAVAVDSCSNAIFLCLKYINKIEQIISIPKHTYISIPCAIRNAGYHLKFTDEEWEGSYQLNPLPIYDSALKLEENMYKGGFVCLSFHVKKQLPIGRGGMILTDDEEAYKWFKLARFNGRNQVSDDEDVFQMIGWNFYMTNVDAARGLWLFSTMDKKNIPKIKQNYQDLSKYDFNSFKSGEYFK
jgi:dTDP-4-amino-4,6-dideoxygalactose transaminase